MGFEGLDLLPQHAEMLAASTISREVANARGYRSVTTKAELERLGFGRAQRRVPGLLIPIWGVHGEIASYQWRPDQPRVRRDRVVKYETPGGSRLVLDVPPGARPGLGGPDGPLFITEGAKKADAGVSRGLCCVDILGVWAWRGRNAQDGLTALPDWEAVALKGAGGQRREVFLTFDSDVMTKRPVYDALTRFSRFLEGRGARVLVVYLPSEAGGRKVGLDDFLAASHSVDDLLALAQEELRPPPEGDAPTRTYFTMPEGTFWNKPMSDGVVPIQLANFRATITADILEDDGVETERFFEVEATLDEAVARLRIPAARFGIMGWPPEHLGHKAVILPGQMIKEHLRVAIQTCSHDAATVRIYCHTGWRIHDGAYVFLHAGGAIGAAGARDDVQVRLEDALSNYQLPAPAKDGTLSEALAAELRLVELAPSRRTVPLVAAVFRVILGSCDFSIHLSGRSGVFKSEFASLIQQHFGAPMNRLNLPAAWSATDNALEGLAFLAKDTILTIDDFAPTGDGRQIANLHAKADRVLRAQGNRSGRQRMRSDATLRAPRPPRGLILSSGEDVPRGQSLRARLLILELALGDISSRRLSACQQDAFDGRYASLTSSYIQWLAPRLKELRGGLPVEIKRLRSAALRGGQHRRTPDIVASLAVGWQCFLAFGYDSKLLSEDQVRDLWRSGWRALGAAAGDQRKHLVAAEPTGRALTLIRSAVSSGAAHLASQQGNQPRDATRFGWRHDDRHGLRPQGACIGWVDENNVYLDPDSAYATIQRMARDQGEPFVISLEMLTRLLNEHGLLASVEKTGDEVRYRIRKSLGGTRSRVLHLLSSVVFPPESPGQPGQSADGDDVGGGSRPGERPGQTGGPGQRPGHEGPPPLWPLLPHPPAGPDGPEIEGDEATDPTAPGGDGSAHSGSDDIVEFEV